MKKGEINLPRRRADLKVSRHSLEMLAAQIWLAYAVLPASMVKTAPVILRPPSPRRYSTMRETSSASASLRKALRPTMRFRCYSERLCVNSVSTKPGAIAFTVMPSLPTSRASDRVNPVAAALVAP